MPGRPVDSSYASVGLPETEAARTTKTPNIKYDFIFVDTLSSSLMDLNYTGS